MGIILRKGAHLVALRLLQDRIGIGGSCGAAGMSRGGVKLWARVRDGVLGHPGSRGSGL